MQETLMLVCPSDACVCAIHEHHEEARAALMRVTSEVRLDQATWSSNARTLRVVMKETSLHDWTKQTGPGMNDDRVKHDWSASLHVHGLGSAVHTWS